MSGTLVLQSFSPEAGKRLDAFVEAGNAETLRAAVTALSGSLKDDELEFSLNFGDYPTSFRGVKTTEI